MTLLSVSRSGLYYEPVAPDADELALMRRFDELHLAMPFYGSRKIAETLKTERPHQALGYQTPEAYYRGFTKAA
jgi:transposase InsO family protein